MRGVMAFALGLAAFAGSQCAAQENFTQRGFLEIYDELYPQTTPIDSANAVNEELFRYQASWKILPSLQLDGSADARFDSHQQVDRAATFDVADRCEQRPALSLRQLALTWTHGKFSATAGKQFIRWGKTDFINPTDRFSPRDFLSLTDAEFLAVTAVRLAYDTGADSLEAVWQPRFTPSRIPLLDERWTVLPESVQGLPWEDLGASYPGGSSFGLRWDHAGSKAEYSLNFYDGFDNLPQFEVLPGNSQYAFALERYYPELRAWGGDMAVPLSWFTVKGEAEYFTSSDRRADEFLLYVLQLERQIREISVMAGYAGEVVTASRDAFYFSPERGLARSLLGRVAWTIDPRRELVWQQIVRQNGRGVLVEIEYSQLFGEHWRAVVGYTIIGGADTDFIGQYRRNSHAKAALRYSF